ncbi:hypothetical protein [Clostridium estertheticum]|uniref:hypothetical protein n=1 Tax=Clostridium estertheticum TaxID=238834 RepID=UPI001CF48D65|nr:hypothetical protein [Clostridium estertheticum]MCB2339467.1 hypothetical protein [Clostridium estertheticum]
MVGIVIVSHSRKVAEGVKELELQMAKNVPIESLTDEMQKNVKVLDVALVEGAITIAVDSSTGKGLHQIEEAVKKLCLHKMS